MKRSTIAIAFAAVLASTAASASVVNLNEVSFTATKKPLCSAVLEKSDGLIASYDDPVSYNDSVQVTGQSNYDAYHKLELTSTTFEFKAHGSDTFTDMNYSVGSNYKWKFFDNSTSASTEVSNSVLKSAVQKTTSTLAFHPLLSFNLSGKTFNAGEYRFTTTVNFSCDVNKD
ncbi:hypothetical protein [Vibrio vulnificus]|uniref:hypothetical protein n=1 Tax=Vibrio vulnificus TaxID=672 RepID=UPI003241BC38